VKLVANKNPKNLSVTPGLDAESRQLDTDVVRLSQIKDVRTSSVDTSQQDRASGKQSPKRQGRNERKLVMATGP